MHLNKVKSFGALREQQDAVAALLQLGNKAVQQLPLGGHSHHLALLLLLRPGVVQQVRVIAHLHTLYIRTVNVHINESCGIALLVSHR